MNDIAALYVASKGPYVGLAQVHAFDEARDARMFAGPWPVVAHPPCQRWGRMWKGQPGNIKAGRVERKGDDSGCFKSALFDVRRFGVVLEHPAGSHAWAHFDFATPPRDGGWVQADEHGGFTCRVEPGRYGHYCAKPTWLYAVGVSPLPGLHWGVSLPPTADSFPADVIARHGLAYCKRTGVMAFKGGGKDSAARIHTPGEFRDVLIDMARSAGQISIEQSREAGQ